MIVVEDGYLVSKALSRWKRDETAAQGVRSDAVPGVQRQHQTGSAAGGH